MPKPRPPYPPQLWARLIELARAGSSPEELGRPFEPYAQTIRNWLTQVDRDDVHREVKALREERDIHRKTDPRVLLTHQRPICR